MKKIILSLAALLITPTFVIAANWNIDPDHSTASFRVKHMVIAEVQGSFSTIEGVAVIDEQDLSRSSIEATIVANSINTGVDKRDIHLKSPDFFDVAQYPTLSFKSKKVKVAANNTLKVTGDLTLHGISKEVELLVTGPSVAIKDPWGNIRKGAKATTTINRKDFGIVWNASLDNGGLLIGEEVEITIDIEFIKQPS